MKIIGLLLLALIMGCGKNNVTGNDSTTTIKYISTSSNKIKIYVSNSSSQTDSYYREIKLYQYGAMIDFLVPGNNDTLLVGADTISIHFYTVSQRVSSGCSSCTDVIHRTLIVSDSIPVDGSVWIFN